MAPAPASERVTFMDMHRLVLARVCDLEIWVPELERNGSPEVLAVKRRELMVNRKLLTLIECIMADRVIIERLTAARTKG